MLELSTPVKYVKRIGERISAELVKRGVETVEDLLYHLPFRYEDRLNPVPMSALKAGTMASVIGEVRGSVLLRTRSMPPKPQRGSTSFKRMSSEPTTLHALPFRVFPPGAGSSRYHPSSVSSVFQVTAPIAQPRPA